MKQSLSGLILFPDKHSYDLAKKIYCVFMYISTYYCINTIRRTNLNWFSVLFHFLKFTFAKTLIRQRKTR